jgi:hypothetical protein
MARGYTSVEEGQPCALNGEFWSMRRHTSNTNRQLHLSRSRRLGGQLLWPGIILTRYPGKRHPSSIDYNPLGTQEHVRRDTRHHVVSLVGLHYGDQAQKGVRSTLIGQYKEPHAHSMRGTFSSNTSQIT